ncbi:MAG TPA: hypothetical protein VGK25_11190 [Ignavibacteria bacterium]|jgi:hypothetical protein
MPITFGRYSDSFKPKKKIEFWNQSEKLFFDKQYLDSYEAFFNYLRDDEAGNLKFTRRGDSIEFEFPQGSKLINGNIKDGKIIAFSDIAEFEKPSVAVMRRLMEMNYTLYYTRFALKDNKILIKFDSTVPAGPPRKLYYAFKELATRADKQDDLLTDDFKQLKMIGTSGIETLPETEKEIKYKYFRKWLEETLQRIAGLNEDAFSGGISYLLLDTAYKIDYLITPEGTLMNEIEKLSWNYFTRDNKPFGEKNKAMKEALQKLLDMPKEKVAEDLYRTKSTFGIANPAPHQAVLDLFNNNINNIKWYIDNNHLDIATVIYEYLAAYCLFSYGLPRPDAKLFHLMMNIINQDYFHELGLTEIYYDAAAGKFNEPLTKEKINSIIKEGLELYPELKFNVENLKFDTLISFLRTFIAEMQQLNYNA